MKLDSWLVARLAKELDEALRGARIQSIEAQPQAVIFFCYRRGDELALHARLDSSSPLLATYGSARPKDARAAGWLGDVATLLRGATFQGIAAIPQDRVIVADVSSRSAFGVPSQSRLVFELQPRKANALVLRQSRDAEQWVIVAAHKRFAAAARRSVAIASAYEPPPPRRATLDRAQFIVSARDLAPADLRGWERALSAYDPSCTPLLVREVLYRIAQSQSSEPAHAAISVWAQLRAEVEAALARMGPVFAWHDGGELIACHVVELHWPAGLLSTGPSLNAWCAAALAHDPKQPEASSTATVKKRLATLLARGDAEASRLSSALDATDREALRESGEAIYTHLAEIELGSERFTTPAGSVVELDPTLTPKQNAAQYFRKYKKARTGAAGMRTRLETLRANREQWEQLTWELDRADLDPQQRTAIVAEIAEAIGMRKRQKKARRSVLRERPIELGGGAIAYVGRSPKDNERLTFTVAGPNDLWFHARGIPGAHVIVKSASAPLGERQIKEAARLAATHSKAAGSAGVDVDFTARKHVRRRGTGGSGLVWYTDFRTVRVEG